MINELHMALSHQNNFFIGGREIINIDHSKPYIYIYFKKMSQESRTYFSDLSKICFDGQQTVNKPYHRINQYKLKIIVVY